MWRFGILENSLGAFPDKLVAVWEKHALRAELGKWQQLFDDVHELATKAAEFASIRPALNLPEGIHVPEALIHLG